MFRIFNPASASRSQTLPACKSPLSPMRINDVSISRFDADRTEMEMGSQLDSLRTPTLEIFHKPTQESFSTPTLEFKTPSDGIDGAVSLPVILARKLPARPSSALD